MHIRHTLSLILLLTHTYSITHALSRTVFVPRSITFEPTYELALTNYDKYHAHECHDKKIHVYATPFYQQSRNKRALARYFLPCHKSCITLKEDGTGDVGSLWFSLLANPGTCFSSRVCFAPCRKVYGAVFTAFFDFEPLWEGGWLGINTALIGAEHTLGITEQVYTRGMLSCRRTACQAFENNEQKHGRITCRTLKKRGLDDIQIKLGYTHTFKPELHAGGYILLGIPTSRTPQAEFLFEPVVGSNHAALGFGLEGFYTFYESCQEQNLALMADFKYIYVFKATERRSFDLKNSSWSRFLHISSAQRPHYSKPAINLLSACVAVKPRSTLDFWAALHYNYHTCNFELGYNFWWRQQEQVSLPDFINTKHYALFDITQTGSSEPTSASTAHIHQTLIGPKAVKSDPMRITLDKKIINKRSAEHPQAHTHKLYAACATTCDIYCYPLLVSIGASYEFTRCISALENWALFVKLGSHF